MTFFNRYHTEDLQGNVDVITDTIKVALMANTYTFDRVNHAFWADVSADELSGTGYIAGGLTLSTKSVFQDDTLHRSEFRADDAEWAGADWTGNSGAIVYHDTTVAGTSLLMKWIDFGGDQAPNGITFAIRWPSPGGVFLGRDV